MPDPSEVGQPLPLERFGLSREVQRMGNQAEAPALTANVDHCSNCVYLQDSGFAKGVRFCTRRDAVVVHDPACEEECSDCEIVQGSD